MIDLTTTQDRGQYSVYKLGEMWNLRNGKQKLFYRHFLKMSQFEIDQIQKQSILVVFTFKQELLSHITYTVLHITG